MAPAGDVDEAAIRYLERRVKDDPENFVAYNKLAGYYLQRMTPEEKASYQTPEQVEDLFKQHMGEVLEGWVALADERLDPGKTPAIWMPGNDDLQFIDQYVDKGQF